MTDAQWIEWLRATGGTGAVFLGVFIIGLIRGWWYLGREMLAERTEKNEWKALAQRNTSNLGGVVTVATKVMENK